MKRLSLAILVIFIIALSVYAYAPKHRNCLFTYNIVIKDIPGYASEIKVWVPYPAQTSYQEIQDTNLDIQWPHSITTDRRYHNKIIYYHIKSPRSSSININESYKVTRYEYSNKPPQFLRQTDPSMKQELKKYLATNRLVTTGPRIKELAQTITRGKDNSIDKARAIYDYIFNNFSYDKSAEGWGQGDTERACIIMSGNCTDFHSFFISLCRASGIPAKFNMGVLLPRNDKENIKSYHCWAEFYAPQAGWVPVDISEAWKDKTKYDYFFGAIDENRIEFSNGRDLVLEPAQQGEPLNYFIYPYVEIDGKTFEKVEVKFSFKDTA